MMDIRKLKTLLDLVRESGVGELEIKDGDDHIRIVNVAPVATHVAPPTPTVVTTVPPVATPVVDTPVAPAPVAAQPSGTPIPSPMVGTFYRAPSPGAAPFVKVGDTVKKGQVVCIIEAMKLLNEVEAEADGVIREVCIENGQPVEFGQPLFILE